MRKITEFAPIVLILLTGLITGSCKKGEEVSMDCVTGVLVGQKCNSYALKLEKKGALGATDWEKKVEGKTEYIRYENVIGLLNLPEVYRIEGKRLYIKLRTATEEESIVPCYLDMPNPPKPVYVVVAVGTGECPE